MSFFKLIKKEKSPHVSDCGCASPLEAAAKEAAGQNRGNEALYCIKVLGTGCKTCHELYENAVAAAKKKGLKTKVEYVTDLQEIARHGIMSTPALMMNDKVISAGKLLKTDEVERLLEKYER